MTTRQSFFATVKWTKLSARLAGLGLTAAGLLLTSCASDRVVTNEPYRAPEVPTTAKMVGGGAVGFSYRAFEPGTLFIVDGNNGRLLASKSMTADEELEVDATRSDILNTARDLNNTSPKSGQSAKVENDTYRPRIVLYFQPQPATKPAP